MNLQNIIKIVLLLGIIGLGYWLFQTIAGPIKFEAEKSKRYAAVKDRLIENREAQIAYKSVNGVYTDSYETLIQFLKTQSYMIVKTVGNPDDSTQIVRRDTSYVSVKDSLQPKLIRDIDSIKFIPFTDGKTFNLEAGKIRKGNLNIPVFQVTDSAPFDENDVYQVGSISEANVNGNWER